ncbi:hypothetical protein G8E10_24095 [Rhizobiaceae bacterium CRRU44]|uniref:Uncharacterized protein n=1 Tax=Ferranicluibacter rubi TaxID=2715133 RepID=A0AA44CD28_9HYPH|nr:hypothetical protein [Ferranicluibacter rubi]NHT78783.1 hypothetical protein [Ferranicluibacter rubi]
MSDDGKKKRRPKGQAALGDVVQTKKVVDLMLKQQHEDTRAKSARLRELRLAARQQDSQTP